MNILLVENDKADADMVREALAHTSIEHKLLVLDDGYHAIQYLLREGNFRDLEQYPDIDCLLLDIHMPILDGLTVLQKIRSDCGDKLPVLMLTRQDTEKELLASYGKGANGFVEKVNDPKRFANKLGMYLSNISTL